MVCSDKEEVGRVFTVTQQEDVVIVCSYVF